jgi:ribosomal protein S18 acetylase RimI-like enzyme
VAGRLPAGGRMRPAPPGSPEKRPEGYRIFAQSDWEAAMDGGTWTVREARREDCPAVLELWRHAEAIPSSTDSLEELERLVAEDRGLFLVAEAHGRLVGSIIGGWDGWRGNMYRLAVAPDCRRRGIARSLVAEVERRLRIQGARRISALVAGTEEGARTFWEAVGYGHDARLLRHAKMVD